MNLRMLDISAMVLGQVNVIHPTLIWDETSAILVDTGFPGQAGLIQAAIEDAGVPFQKLSHIIITHQDIDHIGSLPALREHGVEVLASAAEKPFIQGEQRLLKFSPERVAQAVAALPPSVPEQMRTAFRTAMENPPKAPVDRIINDGEVLPLCGGIDVIITPGHTPGHVCLYHRPTKTLIAGDALTVKEGQLLGPNPQATPDMAEALRSLQKLAPYDIERVICYHGGQYTGEVNRRIAEL